MVDELDRCSPEFAVEFLQLLEHVFHAERVVFIVTINRIELHNAIKSFYGQDFNAEGYLERFFDDVFTLPISNRLQYIETSFPNVSPVDTTIAVQFLEASELSLREINKATQLLKTILAGQNQLASVLMELWIARTLAPGKYRQFISGGISDKELVGSIFANGRCANLRIEREGYDIYLIQRLETTLIMGCYVLTTHRTSGFYYDFGAKSELYTHYQRVVDEAVDGTVSKTYAEGVLGMITSQANHPAASHNIPSIGRAIRLLEREAPSE